ncbi:MAG: disulfide bond formation protein B [Pseudomonadota bacterium]
MPSNRQLLIAIALTCFALIGAALYLQHAKDMLPCPRCVIQRYAFIGAGIFALLGAFLSRPKLWTGLALGSTLLGAVNAYQLIYVINHPGFSCGIDPMETMLNKIPTATYLPWLFRADGLCEAAGEGFFGLPVPYWSAVWFGILAIGLIFVLVRRRA